MKSFIHYGNYNHIEKIMRVWHNKNKLRKILPVKRLDFMIDTKTYHSPIGDILLAEKEDSLIGLWLEGQKYYLSKMKKEEMIQNEEASVLTKTSEWLDRYFRGGKPLISELPLAPIGSEFRQSVWKILCDVPYGEVLTYGEIARMIAAEQGVERMSAQAVGGAVSHNPISIIIPCHRIVGTNGSLTGYAGGIAKKVWLLTHEEVDVKKYFIPKKGTAL
jgi:methylated-DNA-[protein]-cysteine S-methyltransferase